MPKKPMPSILKSAQMLMDDFAYLDDWEERYRYIIDLGDQLPSFADHLKIKANQLSGCTSQVWFSHEYKDAKIFLAATSDSSIVRGLIAVLFTLYNQRHPDEILTYNANDLFTNIGLTQHLSPSRSNGFHAMLTKIKTIAKNP